MAYNTNHRPQGSYWRYGARHGPHGEPTTPVSLSIASDDVFGPSSGSGNGGYPREYRSAVETTKSNEAYMAARAILFGEEERMSDFCLSFRDHFHFVVGMHQGKLKETPFVDAAMISFVKLIEEIITIMNTPGSFDHLDGKQYVESGLRILKSEFQRLQQFSQIFCFLEKWHKETRDGMFKEDFFSELISLRKYLFRLRTTLQKKLDNPSITLSRRLWTASNIQQRITVHVEHILDVRFEIQREHHASL
ncbi:hypothetical protein F4776DRAFT_672212 [Hypoxylon sp. NC0597]|nr:hypothetical protein F4776DRAFT_672212 [Hypoxylon sp. NC0597]